jgi:hypothetical protein
MSSGGGSSSRRCSATCANGKPCRAWALRGSEPPLCAAHSGKVGAPPGNKNAQTHGYYSRQVVPVGDWPLGITRGLTQIENVVVNLAEREWAMHYGFFATRLLQAQRAARRPAFLFLEEAHLFAPQKSRKRVAESLAITKQVARRGRKFGLSTVMASQRPADTEKDVLAQANARFFGRVEILADYEAIRRYLPCGVKMRTLRDLDSGEFFLSVFGEFNQVRIRQRRTPDLGSTPRVTYRQRDFLDLVDAVEEVRSELEASSRIRVFSLAGGEE